MIDIRGFIIVSGWILWIVIFIVSFLFDLMPGDDSKTIIEAGFFAFLTVLALWVLAFIIVSPFLPYLSELMASF